MTDAAAVDDKGKKDRSPSFPFIPLGRAIERARAFEEKHKKEPTRVVTAAATWGYGAKSSGLLQTIAALKQFGLMEDSGSAAERKLQLTDMARRILFDTRPGVREQAIKEAATKPRLIAEYAPRRLTGVSDDHLISELTLDRKFNNDASRAFIKVLDDTIRFANLKEGDSVSDTETDETEKPLPVKAGDYVQWECNGSNQFPVPRRVERIERDPVRGSFVFVEGYAGGLPLEQIQTVPPPADAASPVGVAGERTGVTTPMVRRSTLSLPEGLVALELPEGLSPESYEDLEAWIQVMMRRAARVRKN